MGYSLTYTAPDNVTSTFVKIEHCRSYSTGCLTNDNVYIERSNLEKVKNSLLRIGPLVWNSLPSEFKDLCKIKFSKET